MKTARKRLRRTFWSAPSRTELLKELDLVHKKFLPQRLNRLSYVFREFGPPRDMLLPGGLPSLYALQELWIAYIEGLYLSTITCAHIFVEHLLAGLLILAGEDAAAEGGLNAIAARAVELGYIDKRINKKIGELRTMRIAYSHAHVGSKARSHMGRILRKQKNPDKLLHHDAKTALRIVADFLRHLDPKFGPPLKP